jgi:hypothetical protein
MASGYVRHAGGDWLDFARARRFGFVAGSNDRLQGAGTAIPQDYCVGVELGVSINRASRKWSSRQDSV